MSKNGKSTSNADSDVSRVMHNSRVITPDVRFLMGATRVGKTNLVAALNLGKNPIKKCAK